MTAEPTWSDPFGPTITAADGFEDLAEAMRRLQDAYTGSLLDEATARRLAARIRALADELDACAVDEDRQLAGRLPERAGRGQVLAPVLHIDTVGADRASGHVRIGRFHAGRYAAHGGVAPLIFDEILSRLGNSGGREWARTASLTVNYRAPAPLDTDLTVTAEIVGQQGRKRYLRGELRSGDLLVADAEGLWVQTTPEAGTDRTADALAAITTTHPTAPADSLQRHR